MIAWVFGGLFRRGERTHGQRVLYGDLWWGRKMHEGGRLLLHWSLFIHFMFDNKIKMNLKSYLIFLGHGFGTWGTKDFLTTMLSRTGYGRCGYSLIWPIVASSPYLCNRWGIITLVWQYGPSNSLIVLYWVPIQVIFIDLPSFRSVNWELNFDLSLLIQNPLIRAEIPLHTLSDAHPSENSETWNCIPYKE